MCNTRFECVKQPTLSCYLLRAETLELRAETLELGAETLELRAETLGVEALAGGGRHLIKRRRGRPTG